MKRLLASVAAMFVLTGCSGDPAVEAEREQKVLGVIGAFTGEGAEIANGILRGVQIAVDDYNRDPDATFEVQIRREDTGGTVDGAVKAAQTLAGINLSIGAVGPFTSTEVARAGPVFDEAAIPFVIPSAINEEVGGWRGFRRLIPTDREAGAASAGSVLARIKKGKVAVFTESTEAFELAANGAKTAFDAAEVNVTRFEALIPDTDFGQLASGVASEAPRAVMFFGSPARAASLLSALRTAGYKGLFGGYGFAGDSTFAQSLGEAGDGSVAATAWADPSAKDLARFQTAHRRRFREPSARFAAEAHDGATMLMEALEEVEPERKAITDFLYSARIFRGQSRLYEYNDRGGLVRPSVWTYSLDNGRWKPGARSPRAPV